MYYTYQEMSDIIRSSEKIQELKEGRGADN